MSIFNPRWKIAEAHLSKTTGNNSMAGQPPPMERLKTSSHRWTGSMKSQSSTLLNLISMENRDPIDRASRKWSITHARVDKNLETHTAKNLTTSEKTDGKDKTKSLMKHFMMVKRLLDPSLKIGYSIKMNIPATSILRVLALTWERVHTRRRSERCSTKIDSLNRRTRKLLSSEWNAMSWETSTQMDVSMMRPRRRQDSKSSKRYKTSLKTCTLSSRRPNFAC